MRGVWVDGFGHGIRNPDEVDALIHFAVTAELDTVVAQVVRRADSLARHLDLPVVDDPAVAAAPFDPLDALCTAAAAAGIAVHAWIGVTPATSPHAVAAPRLAPLLSLTQDGSARDPGGLAHLDPGHPDTIEHVASLAADIATHYPVDGVSLDRVRYPTSTAGRRATWGHNPTALARFAAETGVDGPPDGSDATWQAWRRTQVTNLVRGVADAVRAVRADVALSTTGVCFGGLEDGWAASIAHTDAGQDWVGWLRDGIVDAVLAMDYRGDADDADLVGPATANGVDLSREGAVAGVAEPAVLDRRFDDWARLAVEAGGRRAVIGTGWYLHEVATTTAQLRHAERLDVDGARSGGWCGYSYRTPTAAVLAGTAEPAAGRTSLATALRGLAA